MKTLRSYFHLFLLPLLLPLVPLQLATAYLRVHTGRLKAAHAAGDRGALSIEMALIVIVVVAIAGAVLAALTTFGTNAKNKIPSVLPTITPS
ncbi:hypothetical protein GCM10009665_34930 [Kitasatospora nipponensis]|uniref:Uncharacterized protein n=1 Tax=Kitasatospora nipponensis TaxID=258049 RepID=A0ABN1W9C1_9ACTN